MTEEKGLDPAVADRIGAFVQLKGGVGSGFSMASQDLVAQLKGDAELYGNEMAKAGASMHASRAAAACQAAGRDANGLLIACRH